MQYRPTSLRTRLSLLKINIKQNKYQTLKEIKDYDDILEYLNVIDLDHLKEKIDQ